MIDIDWFIFLLMVRQYLGDHILVILCLIQQLLLFVEQEAGLNILLLFLPLQSDLNFTRFPYIYDKLKNLFTFHGTLK
jgi:hypothetical protein